MSGTLLAIDPTGAPVEAVVAEGCDHLIVRKARKPHRCEARTPDRAPNCTGNIRSGQIYVEALDDSPLGRTPGYQAGRRYCGRCALRSFPEDLIIISRGEPPAPLDPITREGLRHLGAEMSRLLRADR